MNDTTVKMAVGTTEARYWQQYAQRQGVRQATGAGAD